MNDIENIPSAATILAAIRETPASYFDFEENGPGKFGGSTRDNGSVGDEEPGQRDINAAKEACQQLKAKFPEAKIVWETVDEWTEISIEFQTTPKYLQLRTQKELQDIAREISHKIEASGLSATLEDIAVEASRQRASICIQTNGMLLQHNFFGEPDGQSSFSLKLMSTGETPQRLLLTAFPFQGKTIDLEGTPTKIAGLLWEGLLKALEDGRTKIVKSLWENEPFSTDVPEHSVLVGMLGFGDPWKNCPFYRLADGNYLLIDGEETKRYAIPKENFVTSTRILGDFFPEAPKGCVSLKEISNIITEEIRVKIEQEAKENSTTTLEAFGRKGKIFQAEDGGLHFIPASQEDQNNQ